MFVTVVWTVLDATAVRGVPIAYQVRPKSSEPSSWSCGAVVVIAPTFITSCVALPQSRVIRLGVTLLSVVSTILLSIN